MCPPGRSTEEVPDTIRVFETFHERYDEVIHERPVAAAFSSSLSVGRNVMTSKHQRSAMLTCVDCGWILCSHDDEGTWARYVTRQSASIASGT